MPSWKKLITSGSAGSLSSLSVSGDITLPYGEINDTATDLNIVGSNAVTLQTSAGTALTIPNASTNVGIGVTGGTYKLEVGSTQKIGYYGSSSNYGYFEPYSGADGHMRFVNNWGASDAHILLLPDSNVGIGTVSPSEKLHIYGSVDNDDVAVHIQNAFDDDNSATPPSAALTFTTASNNAYLRVFGAPANTADNHKIELGSTAGGSYITFKPSSSEAMRISSAGNVGIGTDSPATTLEVDGILTMEDVAAPAEGVAGHAQMFSNGGEMKVNDASGTITTISPHNFELIPEGASEDMAWSHHSVRGNKKVNVDMMKLARLVEELTGEKLVYTEED